MCAFVSLANLFVVMRVTEFVKVTPKTLLDLWSTRKRPSWEPLHGMSPRDLFRATSKALDEYGHGMWGCELLRGADPSCLRAGDMIYVQGTGLLNTQLSDEHELVQPPIDSHVVLVWSVSVGHVKLVNPDRRKCGRKDFRSGINGFFVVAKEKLASIWDVQRLDGTRYTGVVIRASQARECSSPTPAPPRDSSQ
jgi:hypothetical protein